MNDMGWEKKVNYANYLFSRGTLDPQLSNRPGIEYLLVLAAAGRAAGARLPAPGRAVLAGHGASSPPSPSSTCPRAGCGTPGCCPSTTWPSTCSVPSASPSWAAPSPASSRPTSAARSRPVLWGTALAVLGRLDDRARPAAAHPARRGLRLGDGDDVDVGAAAHQGLELHQRLGQAGTSPATRASRPTPSTTPSPRPWRSSARPTAAAGPCGSTRSSTTATARPMALMLLPFWTDGCIGSMEGLYFEASATTPYHFLNQDELSTAPSNAQRDLPYGPGAPNRDEFDLGVAAPADAGREVLHGHLDAHDRPGPQQHRPHRGRRRAARGWCSRWPTASWSRRCTNEPAVVDGASAGGKTWLDDTGRLVHGPAASCDVPLAASGPGRVAAHRARARRPRPGRSRHHRGLEHLQRHRHHLVRRQPGRRAGAW